MLSRYSGLVAVLVLVAGVLVLGVTTPVRRASVAGFSLGPGSAEPVQAYLARAAASVPSGDGSSWALVSPRAELTPVVAATLPGEARLARVVLRVPIERVQTAQLPMDVVDQGGLAGELTAVEALGASRLQQSADAETGRAAAVAQVSADRLRAGCACVLALLVRGSTEQLQTLATRPEVRAVQTAPGDTPPQRLALSPLLPEQTTVAAPVPDDGPVPGS